MTYYRIKEVLLFKEWLRENYPDHYKAVWNERKYRRRQLTSVLREWMDKPIGIAWRTSRRLLG